MRKKQLNINVINTKRCSLDDFQISSCPLSLSAFYGSNKPR